jgi:RNA polymerase sigma-70 factor, ECF subfamily
VSSESREAFERLANAELDLLYRVARRLTRNDTDAEDVVSQALLKAARAWKTFDGRHPRSWLIKILKNEYLGNLRTGKLMTTSLDDAEEPCSEASVWRDLDARALGDEVIEQLDHLPEEYRLAVSLCDVEGLSYSEAAEALDVPVGTVRSRLFRGRRALRDKLAAYHEPESGEVR